MKQEDEQKKLFKARNQKLAELKELIEKRVYAQGKIN